MKSLFLIVMLFLVCSFNCAHGHPEHNPRIDASLESGVIEIEHYVCPGGHLCHDPFRPPNRLVLMPEKKLIRMEKEGEFRIYVENTFSSVLRDLRLIITSPAFDIETVPSSIDKLVPGERNFYLVKLKLREGFKPGDYPLKISVGARSAELRPSIETVEVVTEEVIPEPPVEERVKSQAEEAEEIVVRVEKFALAERWYIYLVPILILFGLLIWRKLKQR